MTRGGKSTVVITGVSGRFPSADSLAEFEYHLYNGLDMVTEDDTRWPRGKALSHALFTCLPLVTSHLSLALLYSCWCRWVKNLHGYRSLWSTPSKRQDQVVSV